MSDKDSTDRAKKPFAERINEVQKFSGTDILKVVGFAGIGCVLMNVAQNFDLTRKPVNAVSEVVSNLFEKIPYVDHGNARIAGREVLDMVFMVTPFLGAVIAGKMMQERNINIPVVSDLLKTVANTRSAPALGGA